MLQRYGPDQERAHTEMLAPVDASTSPTEKTLEAVESNHWRRVAVIAGECVGHPPAPDAPVSKADLQYTLAWWHIRMISLSKMLLFTLLRKELNALWTVLESLRIWDDEKQDVVPLVHSSIVPFSLHVMHAQQLFLGGFQREGAARLCQLIRTAEFLSESVDKHIWHMRVIRLRILLASMLIETHQLPAAATVMADLALTLQAMITHDPSVHLMLTRLYLALGDIQHARSALDEANNKCTEPTSDMAASIATHEALFHYTIRPHEPYNFPQGTESFEASTNNQALTNTMALGALLRGDIVQSIQLLERILQEHPIVVASSKALAHNLLTLHSLGKREYVFYLFIQRDGGKRACRALPRSMGRR